MLTFFLLLLPLARAQESSDPQPPERGGAEAQQPAAVEPVEPPEAPTALEPILIELAEEPLLPSALDRLRPAGDDAGSPHELADLAAAAGHPDLSRLVGEIVAAIDPDTVLEYATWDDERQGVELVRSMPLGPRASADEVTLRTFLPLDGGPERIDMIFPPRIRVGDGLVKATLMNPQLHMVALPTAHGPLPARESLSTIIGVLGFTFGIEQTLSYHRATPCAGAAP